MSEFDIAEINRIWENTKTWKTDDSEVATLFDLAEGLKKSGYKYSNQEEEEQRDASFVILDKNSVDRALEILCDNASGRLGTSSVMLKNYKEGDPAFSIRLNGIEYIDEKLGSHPSSILTSQDLSANPDLLILLLGEDAPLIYYNGNIKTDSENKEVVVKHYHQYIDKKEVGMKRFKKRDLSKSEALDSAANLASVVSAFSSLEKRAKISSDMSIVYFEFERNIGGELGLEFENPYLKVGGNPLYETGAINENLMKKREAEKNLARVKDNQKAKSQIETAIVNYEANILSESGAYFPMFKILK